MPPQGPSVRTGSGVEEEEDSGVGRAVERPPALGCNRFGDGRYSRALAKALVAVVESAAEVVA